jgi:FkbM family methyltransferase
MFRWLRRQRLARAWGSVHGVIHVGANEGQERDFYARLGVPVLWVEPIPEVYVKLSLNIAARPGQRAVQALVGERDGEPVVLHVASNDGASSSILDFAEHADLRPDITYVRDIPLETTTLPTLLHKHGGDVSGFDMLVLDTQGSELAILRGATPLLRGFRYVLSEVADFEAYKGCARRDALTAFLTGHGFRESVVTVIAKHGNGRYYYDILYRARRS